MSALDAFYEMDGRKSRYIGEVLEWYRGEDAGDLTRRELVEKWTCLTVLEKDILKGDRKILMEEKSWRTWEKWAEHRNGWRIGPERRDGWEIREELRDGCQNWSEGCDGSVHIQNWWMEQSATQQSKFIGGIHW